MLKSTSFFLLAMVFYLGTNAQTANLGVEISNIKSISGNIKLGIFDKAHSYRTKSSPFLRTSKEVTDTILKYTFTDVPYGRYAIAVYHDENDDDTLNTRKLGIPIEGIGFSGKYSSRIKPPDFPMASFKLKYDTIIVIDLKYNKKKTPK